MANTRVKGITIEFDGDTSKLNKALNNIKKQAASVDSELKSVNRLLKFNPKNTELLAQKQTILKKKVEDTEKSLKDLKNVQKQLDEKKVAKNSEEYRKVRREIIEAESKLKHYQAELTKLNSVKLTALGKQFDDVGKKMENTGKTMTKYITLPLVAAGGAAVKTGMDFDAAMSQVAATMGTTTDQIEDLRNFAIEMGSTTAFSATDAANALNYMALAGYDAATSMKMLPTVLNLAAAGNMDLAAASDAVTDAQTALGLSTDETIALVDGMAVAASKSNTSVEQLSQAILTIGGTARTLKGGTEELTVLLGVLADNGIKGAEGGTQLRNVLQRLTSPTAKAQKELDALGVSVFDADGNMRDLREVIPELSKALDGMSDAERTAALSKIFNPRDLKAVNALLNTTTDRYDELSLAIDDAGGAAETMAETQLDNFAGSLTMLKSALQGAFIVISDALTPAIRKFSEFLTGVVTKFNQLSPQTQKLIIGIAVAIAALGPALTIAGKALQFFGTILQNVGTVIGAVSKAMTFLAANPVVLIIAGIAALVAAFVILWNKSEAFRNFWINLWNNISTKVRNAYETIKSIFIGIPAFFSRVFGEAWQAIKNKFAGWGSFWSGLWQSVKNKFSDIGSAVGNAIHNAITGGLNAVISKVESIINKGISLINKGIGLINKVKLGKDIGYLEPLSLPRLAQGGVLNGARAVIAGEAGPEAIIPLDKLFNQMDKMANTIAGSGEGVTVNVYAPSGMDVAELAKEIERRIIAAQQRRRQAWA